MKAGNCASVLPFCILLVLVGLVVLSGPASGATQYTITDLGTLPGASRSRAQDINNQGQVVGFSYTAVPISSSAFLWEDGVMLNLGTLGGSAGAYGINESGQVVGRGYSHAFLWDDGVMTDLGAFAGTDHSRAYDINASGLVVGYGQDASSHERACLWEGGLMHDLGTLGGENSTAYAINDSGSIVGEADTASGDWRACLWEDGSILDLGTLGGLRGRAYDINEARQVVGLAYADSECYRPFLWEAGAMQDLGTFGGNCGSANAINASGQIAGWATDPSQSVQACVWIDGAIYNLNDLVINSTGWYSLWYATGINDQGQIVGYGSYDGKDRAFLLTPIPEPSTVGLVGLAFLVVRRRLRRGR